ncbi:Hypothetical predicted protein [Cloeon dipterum]|uniref:Uncharacterized protein n=1 Tax=Cloeon dipterum TaxID=197152 RepID=A0A8S1D7V3_9INSE|nr:Hypothetical predicted protein [Cloeon dipterum]
MYFLSRSLFVKRRVRKERWNAGDGGWLTQGGGSFHARSVPPLKRMVAGLVCLAAVEDWLLMTSFIGMLTFYMFRLSIHCTVKRKLRDNNDKEEEDEMEDLIVAFEENEGVYIEENDSSDDETGKEDEQLEDLMQNISFKGKSKAEKETQISRVS